MRQALRSDRGVFLSPPQDKVHIPGAIYLSIKFDAQCSTEEGCDELAMSSSSDFQQDRHTFSGSQQKWKDFELPGNKYLVIRTLTMKYLNSITRSARVARSVRCPTSVRVMISQFMDSSPASGSVLTAWSLEPASDSVSPSLCAPLLLILCLSKTNKQTKKLNSERRDMEGCHVGLSLLPFSVAVVS